MASRLSGRPVRVGNSAVSEAPSRSRRRSCRSSLLRWWTIKRPSPGPKLCRHFEGESLHEQKFLRPHRHNPKVGIRHHLPAAGYRREFVSGHGDRLLLTPGRRVGDCRAYAHRTCRGCAHSRRLGARRSGRCGIHSDHGAQYTSKDFAKLCKKLGVTQSMGAVGTSADNALAESFNAALKREVLQDNSCWADATTCRRQVFRWLSRYNTKRRHSHCGHLSPATYERNQTPATLPEAA